MTPTLSTVLGRNAAGEKLRTLHTAEVALRLIKEMSDKPSGMSLEDITAYVGKSKHTAYYLMNTLCQEGFAFQGIDKDYHLTRLAKGLTPIATNLPTVGELKDAAKELHGRTLERVYLVVYEHDCLKVVGTWGKQGQPGPPGLSPTIREELHALAVGKAVLADLPAEALESYTDEVGLKKFTTHTKTDPQALRRELTQVQLEGVAYDREEYARGFCCLAIPVRSQNEVVASLGIAVPAQRFKGLKNRLETSLKDIHAVLQKEVVGA